MMMKGEKKKHTHTKIKMKSVWIISYESDRRRNTQLEKIIFMAIKVSKKWWIIMKNRKKNKISTGIFFVIFVMRISYETTDQLILIMKKKIILEYYSIENFVSFIYCLLWSINDDDHHHSFYIYCLIMNLIW